MKKILISCIAVIFILAGIIGLSIYHYNQYAKANTEYGAFLKEFNVQHFDFCSNAWWWIQDGYTDSSLWFEHYKELKEKNKNIGQEAIDIYEDYLSKEEIEKIQDLQEQINNALTMKKINNCIFSIEEITVKAAEAKQAAEEEAARLEAERKAAEEAARIAEEEAILFSMEEENARNFIMMRESGGDYNAVNGQYIGAYQLTASYLGGDYSPANQDRVAHEYVMNRYGSWSAAAAFWQSNGWY